MNRPAPKLSLKIVLPILSVYCCISVLGLYYHELFLDEAHHFLMSRDSPSLADLYYNLRYDGHPRLWGVLLYFITHYITPDPAAMQALQLLLSVSAAFVFLRYGPFALSMKILILPGYYFLFEYNLLSRNYALGIVMLFICCHLLYDAEKNLLWIGALLLLMCNAHLFFAFASIGLFLYLVLEYARGKKLLTRRFIFFALLFGIGLACALIQAHTPAVDNVNMTPVRPGEWLSLKNLSFAADALVWGWLPVPQVSAGHFWNSNWLIVKNIGHVLPVVLFLFFLFFPALFLRKKIGAVVFYYSGIGLLLLFFVVTRMTAARYFGMVYIFFLAASWMTADLSGPVFSYPSIPGRGGLRLFFRVCLYGILFIQAAIGIYALEEDLRRPFSQSKNTADYLRTLEPAGRPIVVEGYTGGPVLSAYLEKKLFYLATGAEGSYCIWNKAYFPIPQLSLDQELARAPGIGRFGKFILVSNRKIGADSIRSAGGSFRLTALKYFENSIVGENYYVYQADPF
jgi:hypothetical protein